MRVLKWLPRLASDRELEAYGTFSKKKRLGLPIIRVLISRTN